MDIYSLLNIKQDVLDDFPLLANRVADYQTERVYNQYTRTLKQIEDRMPVDKGVTVSQQSIDEIIGKVLRLSKSNDFSNDNWSIRELRIVSYYLMKLRGNDRAYEYALSLLNQNWRNLYLNGLVFYLLNSWNSLENHYRELTSKLLIEKLKAYTDNNKRYLCLKDHANLFEEAGPYRLATLLIQRGLKLIDAPKILGYKESALNQSYYSDVIIRYVKNKDIHDLDKIEDIFAYHNLDRTRKLVLAHLVEREDRNPDGLRRTQLCRFVNRILGDVTMASTWAPFTGASDEEAQELKRAKTLVNNWFTQQIIETFFEICVQDDNRKRFWLNYVNIISGFKIVGSSVVKSLLLSDSRIGTLFIKHFIETNSHTSQTSALILFIKDKMLVEFSDTGALYVYNHNHTQVRMVLQRRGWITSTNDLKIPSMNQIIQSNGWGGYIFEEEGRMTHQGDWVVRLKLWMQRMLLYKEIAYSPFNLNKDEDIFKAKPIPVETNTLNITSTQQSSDKETTLNSNIYESTIKAKSSNDHIKPQSENEYQETRYNARQNINLQVSNKTKHIKPSDTEHNTSINDLRCATNSHVDNILKDVYYKICSKQFIKDFMIVATTKRFYLCHIPSKRFTQLTEKDCSINIAGSIKVKRTYQDGWFQIFYYYTGNIKSICFIKQNGDATFSVRDNVSDKTEKILNFNAPNQESLPCQNKHEVKSDQLVRSSLKNIPYSIFSKEFITDYMIVANPNGFYLCYRPTNSFILLVKNNASIYLKGYIWIKKGYYPGWYEIFHCYTGYMKSICFLKQEEDETFSFSKNKCGEIEKKLSFD